MTVEVIENVIVAAVKEHKKKSKKHRRGEAEAGGSGDATEEVPKEKKKKRKVETSAETADASEEPAPSSENSGKKRKRDGGAVEGKNGKKKPKHGTEPLAELETGTAEATLDDEPKKKSKKDKKKSRSAETSEEFSPAFKDEKAKRKTDDATLESAASSSRDAIPAPSKTEIDQFLTDNSVIIHGTTPLVPIISFAQLNVPEGLRAACDKFEKPTPIQACSWPAALAGQDVVGIAETGSGKTMAFGLPALARMLSGSIAQPSKGESTVSALVLAPTRELAIQTHDTFAVLGEPFGIASVAIFGGVGKKDQVDALRSINKQKGKGKQATTRTVVGTPGRILDLINDGVCDLSNVQYLVLDEADRMLDKGFENDIRSIIGHTKQGEERQTLMFSATWPDAVRRLAASFQRDPVRVTVGSDDLTANSRVSQVVEVFDSSREKDSRLLGHLHKLIPKKKTGPEETRILVFALYKKEAVRVESMLRGKGFSVGGLHGDLSQSARMEALQNFKTGKTGLLVATDVAARGLDIPNVAAVINYTFPLTVEDYVHRIGRTGRGGKSGKSITFFTGDAHERALAGELARVLRESGFDTTPLQKFPMTIKKKTHSVYGAFFRDDVPTPSGPTKITFD
ncbi:uncharacterized protein PHACADRAFT_23751 [Phanerochaete carnosa HHB-10118-sp]|uniref:RNA helicase n=1 Tax=Phanerochaete carnosa (strain HHB-10118-sp) TaxID=650164 RepID=K5WLV3_PHACS|nr:uncharacterized protein PHACADRAFT_23751 [Phanerochaete carnosa HHB-10118-sp]EKM60395.1 hypothetical protein PHACADRAFT_23751 [Phanerochaete carnosa HHB-10118-sp]